jgi:valyl-tRNA synthetase
VVNANGGAYLGLDRHEARKPGVDDLRQQGCWKKSTNISTPWASVIAARPSSSRT